MANCSVAKSGDRVLVAVMNNQRDLEIAREYRWYRIPIASVEKFLKKCWEPQWLAFYQTKVFENEAYSIRYYARVEKIEIVDRAHLFPTEPQSEKRYYKLEITPLECLAQPIVSQKHRRITFLQTTLEQFRNAKEIRDLQG
ncbi:hypothetical protein ACKFKG_15525 [Phormidesmis sp. 146-35]